MDHMILLGKILSQDKPKNSIIIDGPHIKITLELDKIDYIIETVPGTTKANIFSISKDTALVDIKPKEFDHKRGVNTMSLFNEIKDKKFKYTQKITYDFKKKVCTFNYKKINRLKNGTGVNELKGKLKLKEV